MDSSEELSLRSDEALFATQLLRANSTPERALALLGRIFGAKTAAIFAEQVCEWAWGSGAKAAQESSITGVQPECVVACRHKRELQQGKESLAVPLPNRPAEVLYLDGVTRSDPRKAELLGGHLSHFLTRYETSNSLDKELKQAQENLSRLSANVALTRRTLAALSGISSSLDLGDLLQEFGSEIAEALPFEGAYLVLGEEIHSLASEPLPKPEQRQALVRLARAAGSSVALDNLDQTPYRELSDLGSCCLAARLVQESQWRGCLILLRCRPYDEHHRAAAEFSVGHLGAALSFSELHQRMQQTQAEVAQAGRMASVGQMAAGLAHEINNPLGSIVLALDSVHRFIEKKPKVALAVLNEAQSAAERAQEIIRKMLHFSRDSRQGFRQSSTHELTADILLIVNPQLREASTEVLLTQPSEDVSLYCNPGELAQVAVNLILNAKDALAESQADRQIQLVVEVTEQRWMMSVQDQGPGVKPDIRERIFDPFFTTKEVGRGTGLGLHVSRQIVESHGGTLTLEPSSSGSTFLVSVPR